jgi:hypothetical protein
MEFRRHLAEQMAAIGILPQQLAEIFKQRFLTPDPVSPRRIAIVRVI